MKWSSIIWKIMNCCKIFYTQHWRKKLLGNWWKSEQQKRERKRRCKHCRVRCWRKVRGAWRSISRWLLWCKMYFRYSLVTSLQRNAPHMLFSCIAVLEFLLKRDSDKRTASAVPDQQYITYSAVFVFQGIIIGSRVNWAADPKLKEIALGLEKNPAFDWNNRKYTEA